MRTPQIPEIDIAECCECDRPRIPSVDRASYYIAPSRIQSNIAVDISRNDVICQDNIINSLNINRRSRR
ncbi:MAG: hypothetical protein EAZ45_20675 [Oscillatoriales cyanobacterium]|nr:MAG: hypothetical protein EAZ45_20675 [Oscillatoriales cyanobacterium]